MAIAPTLVKLLRCPTSGLPLYVEGDDLVSMDGCNRYPVVSGIPCLVPESAEPTHARYKCVVDENRKHLDSSTVIDEEDFRDFIQGMIVSTCGNLFRGTKLTEIYPIPGIPRGFRRHPRS
jgi:hypothetical protein